MMLLSLLCSTVYVGKNYEYNKDDKEIDDSSFGVFIQYRVFS